MSRIKYKSLGELVKILRKQRRLTQCEVGHALQVSKQFISSIERGKQNVPAKMMLPMAAVLCVDVKVLNDAWCMGITK